MSHSAAELLKASLEKYNKIANYAISSYSFISLPTIELLSYSENAIYLVRDSVSSEKYILRVNRPGYHTKPEIESELYWLNAIDELSVINVSLPFLGDNSEFIQAIKLGNDKYYCTLFTFLEGHAPDEDNESKLISQFENLGNITAQLHVMSENHSRRFDMITRLSWNVETILGEKPKWGRWQDGLAITPERAERFQKVAETIKNRLDRFGKEANQFGLIHADLRLANLIVEHDQIKVIDFDDCGFGWYLFDLAASLSFIEHKKYVPDLIQSWLKGYRKIRYLSKEEENEIPTFIMLRRLQLISWIGNRENETTQKMGGEFTIKTDSLAEKYLEKYIY
ncbi:phosphotransferase [Bacillus sp. FJAT-29790]|uniref:phosphotransferase enzyme family protein n=1 Tax=Bacillus sp. FJAT-29790 TaxID=1895002 RepID=UPI001C24DCD2|nr:phosphotransferase [Bacillus sp. FJAT-29790]MBU8878301.1 phosphotransferase [Bacillus sp. FJAT-29790]